LLVLDATAVAQLLDPAAVRDAVRAAFLLHSAGQGRLFPVVREALPGGGIFGIKSGDVPAESLLGFKAAGFWPANRARGGEPHQATILLIDPATGRPEGLLDGNAITTARTAAAGGIGLAALARTGSRTVCVFGTGVQARAQLAEALRALPSLDVVRYVSRSGKSDRSFESGFEASCEIRHATNADRAVAESDVIITATPGGGPLFDAAAVSPGAHINCVGTDTRGKRELPAGLPERARWVVDDSAQSRSIGERQWAPETPSVEIGRLLAGQSAFSRSDTDITAFDLTGLALQDLTVARALLDQARERGLGTALPWPW